MWFRSRLVTLLVITLAAAVLVGTAPAGAALADGSPRWHKTAPGAWFRWSSPVIGDVDGDGSNDVVVGGQDGNVYAWGTDGNALAGWAGGRPALAAVASSPAIGDLDADGANEVVTGAGSLDVPNQQGGVTILERDGRVRCNFRTSDRYGLSATAVFNAPAIGDVDGDGRNEVVFGAFNQEIYVINGACGLVGSFNNTDSVWSAPALYDVDGNGTQEIFIGGDATASAVGLPHSGGYFRSLTFSGGSLVRRWERLSAETFQSAAAVGDVNGDGRLEVVTGSGSDYCRNQGRCSEDSRKVWAFHLDDGTDVPGWPKLGTHNSHFLAAPALGDIDGDGKTDVVVGSTNYVNRAPGRGDPTDGALDVFFGNGSSWSFQGFNDPEVVSPPVIADVDGDGRSEVLLHLDAQLFVLDGKNRNVIQKVHPEGTFGLAAPNAVAVGELGAGRWAVVSAGFDPRESNKGHVYAYDIPTPKAAPWPQFRKNARRLGAGPSDPAPCNSGYWLVAADGGIFAFGDHAFHGSTGNIRLNQPIVGMAATPSGNGYWFVARDGGVFSFGDAAFHGSTGSIRLNSPIVGMAAYPKGKGYWLVAADGGIFSFGDARFHGSTGNIKLNQPVVGMAATPSGNGYWLVAADGGIFSFGDAVFYGSTGDIRLNQPIVTMAAHPSGRGYWFVARDGGIFSFGEAHFFGSTGGVRLDHPVVVMRPTSLGQGYWFAGGGGSVYAFGDAGFCSSASRFRLNSPIVGMG